MARLEEQLAGGGLGAGFGGGGTGTGTGGGGGTGDGFMSMLNRSKGATSLTAAAFMINPMLGLGVGALGMIGKGINAWKASRDKRRLEEKNDKKYAEQLKRQQDRFDMDFRQAERTYGLNRNQFLESVKQQNYMNKERREEKNFKRGQNSSTRLMQMLNREQGLKQQFLSIWSQ